MENLIPAVQRQGPGRAMAGGFHAPRMLKMLEIPENMAFGAVFPVGYSERIPAPPPLKAKREFVSYDRFGGRKE